MKIGFDFTTDDWLAFQANFMANSQEFYRMRAASVAAGPILFFLILFVGGGATDLFLLGFVSVVSALWLALYPKRFDASMIKRTKKLFEEGNNSSLLGQHEIELSEHEIFSREPGSQVITKWSAIQKLSEDQQYMFLYISTIAAIIIPKEKAITSTAKEQVFEYIRSKISRPSAECTVTENEGRA